LLAVLLRQCTGASWSAGMPLLNRIVLPEKDVKPERGRDA
jgi:hypothetical protein